MALRDFCFIFNLIIFTFRVQVFLNPQGYVAEFTMFNWWHQGLLHFLNYVIVEVFFGIVVLVKNSSFICTGYVLFQDEINTQL